MAQSIGNELERHAPILFNFLSECVCTIETTSTRQYEDCMYNSRHPVKASLVENECSSQDRLTDSVCRTYF